MEVTGKNQDECMVALHDCNEDVSRAINFLLESTSDMVGVEKWSAMSHLIYSCGLSLNFQLSEFTLSDFVNRFLLFGRQEVQQLSMITMI